MEELNLLTPSGIAVLLVELIKILYRSLSSNSNYDFPKKFYVVAVPLANFLAPLALAGLKVAGYNLPNDWNSWLVTLVQVVAGSVVALVLYNAGLKPFKQYKAG